jgi:PST family polysaccharide transporter
MKLTNKASNRAQATAGALFVGAAQVYRVGLSFLSSIFLVRLLTPTDFGLIAMVSSCVALVSLIQDLGLNQATIQREQISQPQMSALFWLSVGFSLILAMVLALCAPAVAWFFNDSRLTALTIAFACLVLLGGCQSQQLALLNRELRFKTLAGIDVVAVTVSTIASVGIAWLTSSYWALYIASAASTVASLVCAWTLGSFRLGSPSFEGDFKDILRFASGVSGFNIVNYFARNADNVLIGKFYGGEQLGFYDRAYRLLLFPISQILAPLGRVMLPLLARLQTDPDRYRKAYSESISLLMMASQPGIVFVTVFAHEVFQILFGSHWLPAAPIFQWLGVCSLHQVAMSTFGWLFLSQGRGGDFFKIGSFNATISVASFVVGLPWGPLGVAIAYTIVNYTVLLPVTWWCTGLKGPVSTRYLITTSLPHGVATLVTGVILVGMAVEQPRPGIAGCLGLGVMSYAIYGLVMLAYPKKRLIIKQSFQSLVGMLTSSSHAL